MVKKPQKEIRDVIREVGKFPLDAFQFVQEGLTFAVKHVHGEMSDAQRRVHDFMIQNSLDLDQLELLHINGQLNDEVEELIEDAGGFEELNRHVSGQSLCWGLRDYALRRWGHMAPAVLLHWNIRRTRDFGEIVFALVDNDYLQKQPEDRIEDFEDVFRFDDAFDTAYEIELDESGEPLPDSDPEPE